MIHHVDLIDFEPSISKFYSSVAVLGRKKWNSMTHLSVCSHWLSFSQTMAFKCIVVSKPARSFDSRSRFLRVAAPDEPTHCCGRASFRPAPFKPQRSVLCFSWLLLRVMLSDYNGILLNLPATLRVYFFSVLRVVCECLPATPHACLFRQIFHRF